jgi:protein TonB
MTIMPYTDRWRRALTISLFAHCLLLAGVGWLGGDLIKAAHIPELIEVELITDVAASERKDNLPASAPVAAAAGTRTGGPVSADRPAVVAEVTGETVAEGLPISAPANPGGSGAIVAGAPQAPGGSGSAAAPKIAAPRLLSKSEPIYPEEARQAGAEGTVAVRIEIRENGQPGDISVVRSSGRSSFDEAAVKAIRSWRFVPAQELESGRPVRCYTTVSVVFRLKT